MPVHRVCTVPCWVLPVALAQEGAPGPAPHLQEGPGIKPALWCLPIEFCSCLDSDDSFSTFDFNFWSVSC